MCFFLVWLLQLCIITSLFINGVAYTNSTFLVHGEWYSLRSMNMFVDICFVYNFRGLSRKIIFLETLEVVDWVWMFAVQAWGLSLDLQRPCKELGMAMHTCDSADGNRQPTRATSLAENREVQVQWETSSKDSKTGSPKGSHVTLSSAHYLGIWMTHVMCTCI